MLGSLVTTFSQLRAYLCDVTPLAALKLLGPGINGARQRANKPEIKHLQINNYSGRVPLPTSMLRMSV